MAANDSDPLDGPSMVAPIGFVSQLDNPPNYRMANVAIPTVSLVLATLLVALRIYTKRCVARSVGIADCMYFYGYFEEVKTRNHELTDV